MGEQLNERVSFFGQRPDAKQVRIIAHTRKTATIPRCPWRMDRRDNIGQMRQRGAMKFSIQCNNVQYCWTRRDSGPFCSMVVAFDR